MKNFAIIGSLGFIQTECPFGAQNFVSESMAADLEEIALNIPVGFGKFLFFFNPEYFKFFKIIRKEGTKLAGNEVSASLWRTGLLGKVEFILEVMEDSNVLYREMTGHFSGPQNFVTEENPEEQLANNVIGKFGVSPSTAPLSKGFYFVMPRREFVPKGKTGS